MRYVDPAKVSLRLGLKAVRDALKFTGRATRSEVISLWIVQTLAIMAVILFFNLLGNQGEGTTVNLLQAVINLPICALVARRMQDHDMPGVPGAIGAAVLLFTNAYFKITVGPGAIQDDPAWGFILFVGIIALLFALGRTGTTGPNSFGPDPRQPVSA